MGEHYADAFAVIPGQCLRFVHSMAPGAAGAPHHCREPVIAFGGFVDATGKRHRCYACLDHAGDLIDPHPVTVRRHH